MQFEERLRTHLQERAENIDVPPRHLEISPTRATSPRKALATGVATALVLAAVIGVSFASGRPTSESDLLDLELPASAGLVTRPGQSEPSGFTLQWGRALGVEATQLVEMSGDTVLAVGATDSVSHRGLRVWTRQSDSSWNGPRQAAGLAYQTTTLQADDDLVGIAHGSPWAFQFPELTGGTLLLSPDGQNWSEHALPMVTNPPHAIAELVVAGGGRALIKTMERTPAAAQAWASVGTEFAASAFNFELHSTPDGGQALVISDLDLAIRSFPAGGSVGTEASRARFWATDDYETWTEVSMPDVGADIEDWDGLYSDGQYVATATGFFGVVTFLTSTDLRNWEIKGASPDIDAVAPMQGGGYLATSVGSSGPTLSTSDDFGSWRAIRLPTPGRSAIDSIVSVDTSLLGTALVASTPRATPATELAIVGVPGSLNTLVVVSREARTITLLAPDSTVPLRLEYSDRTPDSNIEYRPDRDSLVLHHPVTGEVMAEVPAFDLLAALEGVDASQEYGSLLFFGSEAEGWQEVDLSEELGVTGAVTDVTVTDEEVVVAFGSSTQGPAQVWVGTAVVAR